MGKKISDLVKDKLGEDFKSCMSYAEDIFSMCNGAYGAIQTGVSVIQALGILEGPEDPFIKLHEKLDGIQRDLDDLLAKQEKDRLEQAHGISLITRTTIVKSASNLRSAVINALAYHNNPTSLGNISAFTDSHHDAQTEINQFKDNRYYWFRVYLDFNDYEDIWSGPLHPPTEDGGLSVWDYLVTLPTYLEALANWIIFLLATDRGYQDTHLFSDLEMPGHIDKLSDALAKILQGFTFLRPPTPYELGYLIFALDNSNFWQDVADYYDDVKGDYVYKRFYPNDQGIEAILRDALPGGRWRLSYYVFGVVEKYTGRCHLDSYPLAEIRDNIQGLPTLYGSFYTTAGGPNSPQPAGGQVVIRNPEKFQKFYDRFVLRHTLRSRRQARTLAVELGLPSIRKVLCDIHEIRGSNPPTLPAEAQAMWNICFVSSVRDLYSMVPDSIKEIEPISFRGLARMVGTIGPITLRRIFLIDE